MPPNFITQIGEKYQPKFAQIMEKMQNIQYTTKNLLHQATDLKRRWHLVANLETQQLTLLTTAHLQQQ